MKDPKIEANAGGRAKFYDFGPFRLNVNERLLFKGEETLPLSGKAFDLLLLLVESAGHLKNREELIEALWPNTIVEENSLTQYVSAIRKALGDEGDVRRYVKTVHGHGYRFIAPVEVEEIAPPQPVENNRERETEDVGAAHGRDSRAQTDAGAGEDGRSRAWRAPTRRRTTLFAVAAAAIVVIAGVLIWRFVPFGPAGKSSTTPVIAVLPFENLSANQSNVYFAAGIQDTILSKLAGIGGLRVISRTSTERYPSHPANLKRVAAQLGATAVMEGSVQKSGDRVLINVQLVDAQTDEHIWAHVYTRSLVDIFAVESDVATQVAAALKTKLIPAEVVHIEGKPTHDPQAYLLFLKANYYANRALNSSNTKDSAATVAKAKALYRQAIAADPKYAIAYAKLSLLETHAYQFYNIAHTSQTIADAEHAAKQALALKPDLPEAHLAMGYVEYYGHQNYAGALAQIKQISPNFRNNNAEIIGIIAYLRRRQGKWQAAFAGLQYAAKLDPRNPRWFTAIGTTLLVQRRYAQAVMRFNQALAIEPYDYSAAAFKALTLLNAGKPLKQVRRILEDIPVNSSQNGMIYALHFKAAQLSHHPETALDSLKDAPDWVVSSYAAGLEPSSLLRAQAWAALGNKLKAQLAYEKARNTVQTELQTHPESSKLWSFLGLTEAGLGEKSQAIHAGVKATTLMPVSKDALNGPSHLTTLAKIYTQVGEPNQALKLLRRLLAMPAGSFISVPLLERDPIWDPLRQNPEFQKLLKEYGHKKAPAPKSESVSG